MEKEQYLWTAGITPTERKKAKRLVELYKTEYNKPQTNYARLLNELAQRVDEFSQHNLYTEQDTGNFSILTIRTDEKTYNMLETISKQKMRDRSNLTRWLINTAYEIELGYFE